MKEQKISKKQKKQKKRSYSSKLIGAGYITLAIFFIMGIFLLAIGLAMLITWLAFDIILGYSISLWDLFLGSILVGLLFIGFAFIFRIIVQIFSR